LSVHGCRAAQGRPAPRRRSHAALGADDGRVRDAARVRVAVAGGEDVRERRALPRADVHVGDDGPRHRERAVAVHSAPPARHGDLRRRHADLRRRRRHGDGRRAHELHGHVRRLAGRGARAHRLLTLILAWHPWAVIRIASFVVIGVTLSIPLLSRAAGFGHDLDESRRLLTWAAAGLIADIVLKALLAPAWQRLLLRVVG